MVTILIFVLLFFQQNVITNPDTPATTHIKNWEFLINSKGKGSFALETGVGPATENDLIQITKFNSIGLLNGNNSTSLEGNINIPVDFKTICNWFADSVNKTINSTHTFAQDYQNIKMPSIRNMFLYSAAISATIGGISYLIVKIKFNEERTLLQHIKGKLPLNRNDFEEFEKTIYNKNINILQKIKEHFTNNDSLNKEDFKKIESAFYTELKKSIKKDLTIAMSIIGCSTAVISIVISAILHYFSPKIVNGVAGYLENKLKNLIL